MLRLLNFYLIWALALARLMFGLNPNKAGAFKQRHKCRQLIILLLFYNGINAAS